MTPPAAATKSERWCARGAARCGSGEQAKAPGVMPCRRRRPRLGEDRLMAGERGEISDRVLAKVLGQELRVARESRGWSRTELVGKLPSGIGDRTLLSYEHGIRTLSVTRFIEICRALGVAASEILDRTLEKARDLRAFSLKINLEAILRDDRAEFEPVRRWAVARLREDPTSEVLLAPVAVRELAVVFGLTHAALAAYFVEFTSADDARSV